MPFEIIRQDLTLMNVDVIVNSTHPLPIVGGGVDHLIHVAAGPKLMEARQLIGTIPVGKAYITEGFFLPSPYVIHTVGPIWEGGDHQEERLLASCYQSSLELALKHQLHSIAFPLISSGVFGYPKDLALNVAINTIKTFLNEHDLLVYLVVYDEMSYELSKERMSKVTSYIQRNFVDPDSAFHQRRLRMERSRFQETENISPSFNIDFDQHFEYQLEKTFSESLLSIIDHKELSDVTVYRKANMDKRHFSKIRSNTHYHPSKYTAIALCLALELNLDQTKDLIGKAGYALSKSNLFDVIVEFHIKNAIYDIYEINQVLFKYKQKLIAEVD
jgi:O-acetyl-ADP-ribose deacetylase (regulator of RNase III)